ncbi:MAG TPA: hypothetical protein PLQ93_11955 [Bacteroidia bacterium]|nr:hypothetical protein [Bacteroidia bacterium]
MESEAAYLSTVENISYFSNEALARFVSAQNRVVSKVICHLWVNKINPEQSMEIIDNIELLFQDQNKLTISCNPEGTGLDAVDFDFDLSARQLETEFDGKIKLYAIDASGTKMWSEVIGKTLKAVKLSRDNDHYKADSIVLDFDTERREISIGPLDGLVIDYYEDL